MMERSPPKQGRRPQVNVLELQFWLAPKMELDRAEPRNRSVFRITVLGGDFFSAPQAPVRLMAILPPAENTAYLW
jgi:hypothetical protein